MRKLILLSLLLLFIQLLNAHPGIGIVLDSKGNIFYTDLKQVWMISADGNKSKVVMNVHTHELHIDKDDVLYGEHLWYNGEKQDTWGHYVWRRTPDGTVETIKGPLPGFLEDYSFIRDAKENMYWVERFKVSRFKKKTPQRTTTIGEGKFRNIRWMSATPEGTLFFMDLDRLYKLEAGKFTLLADKLNESTSVFSIVGDTHNAYGIWTDAEHNIYVALFAGQRVKKITPDGKVSTVLHSPAPWGPTNGLFDKDGNLWILEYTIKGDAQVRKIDGKKLGKKVSYKATFTNDVLTAMVVMSFGFFILYYVVHHSFPPSQKANVDS